MTRLLDRLTLTRQWVLATLLAVLPLVIAVLYAANYLALQAQTQRHMVASIGDLNELDTSIISQMSSIERSARQYLLLRNPRFLELFHQHVESVQPALRRLGDELQNGESVATLQQVLLILTTELSRPDPEQIVQEGILANLQQANTLVGSLSLEVDERVQAMLDERDLQFEQVMRHLMLIGIFALPGTLLLVVLSSVTVTRPVRRLVNAIHRLGHGHWQDPIQISGPADLRSLGASLEWMRNRLEATEKQKQAFTRHITHELKTPLAAIVEAGALLRDEVPGPANRDQQQVLGILMSSADSLHALIQQLLNYNAVAHGMLDADAEVDLPEMCDRIRTKLMDSRPSSRCQWSISGTPDTVRSDPQALEMILSNLLSNAHDFTPESGRVAVTWGVEAETWWLCVADTGPGMTEEERENIFKPFFQGKARRRGPLQGTGLGLAIVQECVAHLHGKIEVESSPKGSAFTLRFPLRSETYQ
ncbi:MAG: ATP-binding protein [Cellvibrionaceae bacterium]|nr:ATP-binding protein [Cellvibrionaceae bacterium]